MPTDLARAIVAFIALVREAEARGQDRKRFRAAAEDVALVVLEQLRVGDRATVGKVVYEAEQVTWPEATEGASGSGASDRHGARALLRGGRVLVVAERVERGRGPGRARTTSVGPQLARRRDAQSNDREAFDLRLATDEDRLAFAHELGAVIEGFGLAVAAEAGQLRRATTDLVALLVG
ncbi:MAG TPA: hypothetical protein VEQ11_10715 [Chloroflexota bacterium]|nr:hypothetical protein [Chloroflexota bacterium]